MKREKLSKDERCEKGAGYETDFGLNLMIWSLYLLIHENVIFSLEEQLHCRNSMEKLSKDERCEKEAGY